MIIEQIKRRWRTSLGHQRFYPRPSLDAAGLLLGAGTLLLAKRGLYEDRDDIVPERERLLVLLSAAYGPGKDFYAVGHLRRAASHWSNNDPQLAALHLSLSGVGSLDDPIRSAYRLFVADGLLGAGVDAGAVLKELDLDFAARRNVGKGYNPDQPRNPAGTRQGGEWSSGASGGSKAMPTGGTPPSPPKPPRRNPRPARGGPVRSTSNPTIPSARVVQASALVAPFPLAGSASPVLGDLSGAALTWLGRMAFRSIAAAGGAAVGGVGLAFIPAPMGLRTEGEVQGVPGLSYLWNSDETHIKLTLKAPTGRAHVCVAELGDGDLFRDPQGRVVGRVLPNGVVAIDPSAAVGAMVEARAEPKLCPVEAPDKFGQGMNSAARAYEDYMKQFVNPGDPTPSGYAYYRPIAGWLGRQVTYDDCQQDTGILFEAKGPWFGKVASYPPGLRRSIAAKMVDQALRQIQGAQDRPIVWMFANQEGADFAKSVFSLHPGIGARISVQVLPWSAPASPRRSRRNAV